MTKYKVQVLSPDGSTQPATADVTGEDNLNLVFQNDSLGRFEASESDLFEAMIKLRLWLEAQGYKLLCNGARLDVYPSRMARQMGAGFRAYKMTMGRPAEMNDRVKILDPAPADTIATVAEQKLFYENWLNSIAEAAKAREQEITPDLIEAAKKIPNGYVYKINGQFGPNEAVPPEAIMGAWKVNEAGNIVGDFIPNSNYRTKLARDLANTNVSQRKTDPSK
jgi:hypothetical protein